MSSTILLERRGLRDSPRVETNCSRGSSNSTRAVQQHAGYMAIKDDPPRRLAGQLSKAVPMRQIGGWSRQGWRLLSRMLGVSLCSILKRTHFVEHRGDAMSPTTGEEHFGGISRDMIFGYIQGAGASKAPIYPAMQGGP